MNQRINNQEIPHLIKSQIEVRLPLDFHFPPVIVERFLVLLTLLFLSGVYLYRTVHEAENVSLVVLIKQDQGSSTTVSMTTTKT